MNPATALVGPAVTVALVLLRPKVSEKLAITPAIAAGIGVCTMLAMRAVAPIELFNAIGVLWRPFIGVAAIMITAAVAEKAGLLDRAAAVVELTTKGPVWLAFAAVFTVAAFIATLFNNDAAILTLTPLIVHLVRRRYPQRSGHLTVPFAFAVFAAAGVAPLVISNPINMVVASTAGIGFNAYAKVMIPVAAAGLFVAFVSLCVVFRKEIGDPVAASGPLSPPPGPMKPGEKAALLTLVIGLGMYPVMSLIDGPVWLVSLAGAILAVRVCHRHGIAKPAELGRMVAWDVLLFLFCVFVMAQGLRASGVVGALTSIYSSLSSTGGRVALIGFLSALGSAVLNNHPMAILNALAIGDVKDGDGRLVLAALIGGDLGPRLLPIGSLAGLLWLRALAQDKVDVTLKQFVKVGVVLTVPALVVSLIVLMLVW